MGRPFKAPGRARWLTWALTVLVGLGLVPGARAGLVLDIAAVAGADVEFKGTGTGATFTFNNNHSGQGFVVTASSGVGDAVGLEGTLGGTYSYSKGSISTLGAMQTAPVSTVGGTLTITDAGLHALTGTVTGVDVTTLGGSGTVNVSEAVNLSNVSYSGTNADLKELRNEAAACGGIVTITFQLIPAQSLTQLAAAGADHKASYSGSIATVPEPSSLALGCIALGMIYGLRWHRTRGARARPSI